MDLEKIIKFFDSRFLISLANTFALNKERIVKDKAISEILKEIDDYFKEHYIKKHIIAEEAKLMQKYYFKKKINTIKIKKRVEEYKKFYEKLSSLSNSEEIIQFLCLYYLNDMAADFNPAFLLFFKEACKFMFREFIKNFKIIADEKTLKIIKNIQGKYSLFYLPNHVSNADHIPIAFSINMKGLFHPVIVAGANLYRGVSKILLPKLNVEKLRRDFITDKSKWLQNPLYSLCFKMYNNYLWKHNEPFLFYIEGGRSRDGIIGEPKYGIISEIFNFIKKEKKKSFFIPITISYTIVPEDVELYESFNGKKNISYGDLFYQLSKLNKEYRKFKKPYIYVKFLEPIEISPDTSLNYKDFSKSLIELLRKNVVITPTYLLAKVLDENGELTLNKLENIYNEKAKNLESKDNFKQAIDIFIQRNLIKISDNYVKIVEKGIIKQYSNRIKYLT